MFGLIIITAFLTSLISLIILRPFAIKFNLVDFPNERKNHTGNIPLVGGVCVFLGCLISYFSFVEFDKFSSALLITASLILILGVWDDLANLKAKTKIFFQAFLSAIMIYVTDVKLESLDNFFGVSYPLELGILSIPVTIIGVIALTNAINMIDGIDGLAPAIVLLAITGLVFFNVTLEFSPFTCLLLAVASALLPFIIFNIAPYPKIKVFLGDGGSLFLGYIISWALIYSAENVNIFTTSFALWCVAIPVFDFFSVIIMRMLKKQPIMIARRDHIHHFLQSLGFSNKLILLLIFSSGLTVLLIGSFIENKLPALSFAVFIILFLFYLFLRTYNKSDKKGRRH
jgi:UDP-GlcNAc:undecaprenyl-phosphate/decaprenyl-phosphate GlcNAc-1-phosphate transferase